MRFVVWWFAGFRPMDAPITSPAQIYYPLKKSDAELVYCPKSCFSGNFSTAGQWIKSKELFGIKPTSTTTGVYIAHVKSIGEPTKCP